ncbi:Secreted lipase [Lachnellula suecica]|uniref:Secreted lipase n=1 Tax=Lachnellula suecica TaxID=602035 RepID=A0A8T9C0Q5_9HELO|nr:Secreted lipase [Lachnellula suecica]
MPPTWLCAALLGFLTQTKASPSVLISRSQVTYRGIVSNSIEHFQNIKFAKDTSGVRRFAPPELFNPPSRTVIDAALPGPACPQLQDAMPPFFSEEKEIGEDCLNLRIARPEGTTSDSKFPVVVWLHGGGVVKGSAYDSHFDPENLVKLSVASGKPIIYAAINYRLTIFGFARLPVLKDWKSLNVGMRDQRAGFQWIKDNIDAFGGDPEKITAFGLSAGGTFISLHPMAYGGTKGVPFQQAWMMSGPPGTALNLTSDATTQHTLAVAEKVGCGNFEAADGKTLDCLREIPMRDLLNAAMGYSMENHPPAGAFTFIPSLDEDLIPDRPSSLMTAGKFVKGMPLILGWCQDDGAINVGPGPLIQTEDDMIAPVKAFASHLSEDQLSSLFDLYPAIDFEEDMKNYDARRSSADPVISVHYFRVSRILRDLLFTCSSIEFGYQMTKHSRAIDPQYDGARLYTLNQSVLTPIWKGAGMPYVGVSHGSDTNYIFNGVFPEGIMSGEDEKLSGLMSQNLVNFAYHGDPNIASDSREYPNVWPPAHRISKGKSDVELANIDVQVFGGPYGTGSVAVSGSQDKANEKLEESDQEPQIEGSGDPLGAGMTQQILSDTLEFGAMKSSASQTRNRLIRKEKLLERCAYIVPLVIRQLGLQAFLDTLWIELRHDLVTQSDDDLFLILVDTDNESHLCEGGGCLVWEED